VCSNWPRNSSSARGAASRAERAAHTLCVGRRSTRLTLYELIAAHGGNVYKVAISPDGARLATACADNTIRLWDMATRQEVAELRGHGDYVHSVAWSPDGTRLASASGDHTVRIWDTVPLALRAQPKGAYVPPKGYVAYRAEGKRGEPAIRIDGKLDDEAWKAAPWTDDFVDILGDYRIKPRFRTRVKMLWDDEYLYIGAEMEEPHVQGTFTKRDSYIFHEDNDFEVFINPDGNNHNYAELEMNALNTVWDLRLKKPYRDKGRAEDAWDIPGLKTAVHVDGTINNPRDVDKGWSVEIAIPWEITRALNDKSGKPPRDGDQAHQLLARAMALRRRGGPIRPPQGPPRGQLGLVAAVGGGHASAGDVGLRAILVGGARHGQVSPRPLRPRPACPSARLCCPKRLLRQAQAVRARLGGSGLGRRAL
jgi:hypothetical protein